MRNTLLLLIALLIFFIFTCCSSRNKENPGKPFVQNQTNDKNVPFINTIEEIKVYNNFIDQVYRILYCHIDMLSPEEFKSYRGTVRKEEYDNHKKRYNEYLRRLNQMIDTSIITALVGDSLDSFEIPRKYILSRLDSSQISLFHDLIYDSTKMEPASFILDSLKSKKIFFERIPSNISRLRWIDWEKTPRDSSYKYEKQLNTFWQEHFGKQIGNKYYIGSISMSRVKFNKNSTLCLLECGYLAQNRCGYGHYYMLQKIKGKWIIVKEIDSWVS